MRRHRWRWVFDQRNGFGAFKHDDSILFRLFLFCAGSLLVEVFFGCFAELEQIDCQMIVVKILLLGQLIDLKMFARVHLVGRAI